jgi:hypothetical protein
MIVPTKVLKKNEYEISLMLFPIFGKQTLYEFHLVKLSDAGNEVLKRKIYKSLDNLQEIAGEFGVKPKDIKELVEKLYSS